VLAAIFFIACVEFDVTISGSFVLEESQTEIAAERHLVAVRLSIKSNTHTKKNNKLIFIFRFYLD
jgi:hypothetical protein